jgi:predicted nucleic acid-binding protein
VRRWLLDTNVVSELRKTRCDEAVKTWSEAQPAELLYLSRITIAEIRFRIEQHARESFRDKLETSIPGPVNSGPDRMRARGYASRSVS